MLATHVINKTTAKMYANANIRLSFNYAPALSGSLFGLALNKLCAWRHNMPPPLAS